MIIVRGNISMEIVQKQDTSTDRIRKQTHLGTILYKRVPE